MKTSEQKSATGSFAECTEQKRLNDARDRGILWNKWGPYLSERQWGTLREDYSQDGNAWKYFSHDQARSRAYRWGEDGIAGISDDKQQLCFAVALWNGRDPILMKCLYKYPQREFPYQDLVETNRRSNTPLRPRHDSLHCLSIRTGAPCEGSPDLLFTENESNSTRLWGSPTNPPM